MTFPQLGSYSQENVHPTERPFNFLNLSTGRPNSNAWTSKKSNSFISEVYANLYTNFPRRARVFALQRNGHYLIYLFFFNAYLFHFLIKINNLSFSKPYILSKFFILK